MPSFLSFHGIIYSVDFSTLTAILLVGLWLKVKRKRVTSDRSCDAGVKGKERFSREIQIRRSESWEENGSSDKGAKRRRRASKKRRRAQKYRKLRADSAPFNHNRRRLDDFGGRLHGILLGERTNK